jgi:hypothetical protein
MSKRCSIMVSAGTYRQPGQCAKRHGLRLVRLTDRKLPVCAHHRAVLDKAGVVPRVVGR